MMSVLSSPYEGFPESQWSDVTEELLAEHPLHREEVVEVILQTWEDIFESGIGSRPFKIGVDIFPRPQILSFFLHELVALEFEKRYPDTWRRDRKKDEKDLVCIVDDTFSTEIKASSHKNQVFGNRSYAQPRVEGGKSKEGYYITINFEKLLRKMDRKPQINIIRFGWLDHFDWIAQRAATGQQARLRQEAYKYKLLEVYRSGGT